MEDNEPSRRLLTVLLEFHGHTVFEAADVDAARRYLATVELDVVLMDLHVPGGGGSALLLEIRGERRLLRLAVVAVTACAMEGDRDAVLCLGFDDYVSKPIDTRTFPGEIDRWVAARTPQVLHDRPEGVRITAADRQTNLSRGRIWVVENEPEVLRAYGRALMASGFDVVMSSNAADAERGGAEQSFDAIVSDINMPGTSGLDLLRVVRRHDLDVPVILITATTGYETAMEAVEWGAFRYLQKPLDASVLIEEVSQAVLAHRLARVKRQALQHLERRGWEPGDKAGLDARFDRALETLWMAYQPIVAPADRRVAAYEALVRGDEPAIPNPGVLFDAAERLGRTFQLGRLIRDRVAQAASSLPDGIDLFVNVHGADLSDENLYDARTPFSQISTRVVLEITERASLSHLSDVRARIDRLKQMGFRIAIDDLGAGYAGLSSFALLQPQIVKLDMSLVRNLHREPIQERLVRSMTELCREMGVQVVAEGVETAPERDALVLLGCEYLQGYYYGRPSRGFAGVTFE